MSQQKSKSVQAYQQMMSHVHNAIDNASQSTHPPLQQYIDNAIEKAVELGELSREEAERIGGYLQRDLQDAAEHLVDTESELASWLRFDIELIEQQLLDMFAYVADKTRLELLEIEDRAKLENRYHSGEITGPGALQCTECNVPIYFHATDTIPQCPACDNNEFTRIFDQ